MGRLAVFIVFFLLYAALVKTDVSWNDGSRFAALESVVERNTFAIDGSSFLNITKDRVFYNGHFYSDKAPGLVFLAVPVYFALHLLDVPLFSPAGIFSVNLVVAFFSALLVAFFFDALKYFVSSWKQRVFLCVALGLATGVVVYSGVFVSHNVAAFFIFASFYFVLRYVRERRLLSYLVLAGLFGGVAVVVEYPSLILLFFIFLYAFVSSPDKRKLFVMPAAAVPFILLLLLYNLSITGNVLVSPYHYLHNWDGSPFSAGENTPSLSRITLPRLSSMLFAGPVPRETGIYIRGLFVYSPFLLLSFFSLVRFRREALFVAAFAFFSLFYLSLTEVTGGCNYVNRYLIPVVPFLLVIIASVFGSRFIRSSFYILFSFSLFANVVGALSYPFTCSRFPLLSAVYSLSGVSSAFSVANLVFAVSLVIAIAVFIVAAVRNRRGS
ncbi:hypothetical protein HYU12_02495 [Candidatus Woesearchaeota archaeon]|nr:hypothetical protein [Candidatus Woesearchaeota archaeon]